MKKRAPLSERLVAAMQLRPHGHGFRVPSEKPGRFPRSALISASLSEGLTTVEDHVNGASPRGDQRRFDRMVHREHVAEQRRMGLESSAVRRLTGAALPADRRSPTQARLLSFASEIATAGGLVTLGALREHM